MGRPLFRLPWLGVTMVIALSDTVRADNFNSVRYEAATDQLVVTLNYRGSNPDHEFTLRWGACRHEHGAPTVSAEVLDSQFRDPARRDFRKTVRFSLAALPCRPARVVLTTAPRYYIEVQVPAVP